MIWILASVLLLINNSIVLNKLESCTMKKLFIIILFALLSFPALSQVKYTPYYENRYPLSEEIREEIMSKGKWSDDIKTSLVNFLEDYQTAFMNKSVDFIERTFDPANFTIRTKDDVGVVYKETQTQKYMQRYKRCCMEGDISSFSLSDPEFRLANPNGEYYVVLHFKQEYTTQNYNEEIYVYLVLDFNSDAMKICLAGMNSDKDKLIDFSDIRYQ